MTFMSASDEVREPPSEFRQAIQPGGVFRKPGQGRKRGGESFPDQIQAQIGEIVAKPVNRMFE